MLYGPQLTLALGLLWSPAAAAVPEACRAAPTERCFRQEGLGLVEQGRSEEAIELLKPGVAMYPESRSVRLLLARAYLDAGNDFWALRTLGPLIAAQPDDCEPRLWAAHVYIGKAALPQAREQLDEARCKPGTPDEARRQLLLATIENHAGNPEIARAHLEEARRADGVWAEDHAAIDRLTASMDPGYQPPIAGRLDLMAGWTSNARAGSPTESETGGGASSGAAQMALWLQVVPIDTRARPSLETEVRGIRYTAEAGRELSYVSPSVRPGVILGRGVRNALLGYRYEALVLAGGDEFDEGPVLYYEAHRVEAEVGLLPWLSAFGGAGRRVFRQISRTRTEIDGGVSVAHPVADRVRLVGALSLRWHDGEHEAYDLRGGSAVASAQFRLPRGWSIRTGGFATLDMYPRSAGYSHHVDPDDVLEENRRDLVVRGSLSAWSPAVWGVRGGVTWEVSRRVSTADRYDYDDQRVLGKLVWAFSADPRLPDEVSAPGHVPMDWGERSEWMDERVQDLLRQNEATQRESSCIE